MVTRKNEESSTQNEVVQTWTTDDGRRVEIQRYRNKKGAERYSLKVNGHALQVSFSGSKAAHDWFAARLQDQAQPDVTDMDRRGRYYWVGAEQAAPKAVDRQAVRAAVTSGLEWEETSEGGWKARVGRTGLTVRIRPDRSGESESNWYVLLKGPGRKERIGAAWEDRTRIFYNRDDARTFVEQALLSSPGDSGHD